MTDPSKGVFKTVAVSKLRPNPFRRLKHNPIIREKVEALKESITSTGFWPNIVARETKDGFFEISYGHHRLEALKELKIVSVKIVVEDLSNDDLLRRMAFENLAEWGSSVIVEVEILRATIEAYGRGDIDLLQPSSMAKPDTIRYALAVDGSGGHGSTDLPVGEISGRPYTSTTLANYLKWTRRQYDGLKPNKAFLAAFKALEMIEEGFLDESALRGVDRKQALALIDAQKKVRQEHYLSVNQAKEEAKRARELASKQVEPRKKAALTTHADQCDRRAEAHKDDARRNTREFGNAASKAFKDDQGRGAVAALAEKATAHLSVPRSDVKNLAQLKKSACKELGSFLIKSTSTREMLETLAKYQEELSDSDVGELVQSLHWLIERAQNVREKFRVVGPEVMTLEVSGEQVDGRQI